MSYLGLTGAGLPAPGATPGSVSGGVPGGTGDPGKPGEVRIKFLLWWTFWSSWVTFQTCCYSQRSRSCWNSSARYWKQGWNPQTEWACGIFVCFCFRITAFSQLCSSSLPVLPSFVLFCFFYCLSYQPLTTSSFPLLAESGFIFELLGHSSVNDSGTGSVLAGPTPIADSGKAPEVPQLSKTCCFACKLERLRELWQ